MKKYNNYKDSEIEWIGKVPMHWKMEKLKYIFDLGKGLSITKENLVDEGIPCVSYGEIHSKYGFAVDITKHKLKCVDTEYLNRSIKALMKQGEFIFADTSEDIEGSGNFTHVKSDGDIFAGYHTITARPIKKNNPLYFAFLFDSIDFRTQIRSNVKGIKVLSITQGILKDTFVWYPPIEEQTAIANYLSHKTTLIDNLIAKKEQFITLLQEERTAVINQSVTKGLDPNVKMKDSGIEWLGEIPEHWNVTKIKYQFNVQGGGTPSKENPSYWNGDIPWVSPKDMKQKEIIDTIDKTNLLGISNSASKVVEPESLLMVVRSGILQRTIPIGINKIPVSLNQDIKSFKSKGNHSIHLLYYFIKGWESQLLEDWSKEGATVESIEMEYLLNFSLPMPPPYEQSDIIKFIETNEKRVITIINKTQKEIKFLKEYKTALISEIVTGKRDVRDVVLN